jgi:hypothetical protein
MSGNGKYQIRHLTSQGYSLHNNINIFWSTDYGQSFEETKFFNEYLTLGVNKIDISEDCEIIIAKVIYIGHNCCCRNDVAHTYCRRTTTVRSLDKGKNWEEFLPLEFDVYMTSTGNCLFGFSGSKLYKSFDYGDTWKEFSQTPSNIISLDISATGEDIIAIS